MSLFQVRLLLCREKITKTQQQVATDAGLNYRTYCRYERGEAEPSMNALIKLADYFDVSLDYLTGRTEDPTPPKGTQ